MQLIVLAGREYEHPVGGLLVRAPRGGSRGSCSAPLRVIIRQRHGLYCVARPIRGVGQDVVDLASRGIVVLTRVEGVRLWGFYLTAWDPRRSAMVLGRHCQPSDVSAIMPLVGAENLAGSQTVKVVGPRKIVSPQETFMAATVWVHQLLTWVMNSNETSD